MYIFQYRWQRLSSDLFGLWHVAMLADDDHVVVVFMG